MRMLSSEDVRYSSRIWWHLLALASKQAVVSPPLMCFGVANVDANSALMVI